jgi:hypothetical protein
MSYLVPLGLLALAVHPDSPLSIVAMQRPLRAVALELALLGLLIVHLVIFRYGDSAWTSVAPSLGGRFATGFGLNSFVAVGIATLALASLRFIGSLWARVPVFLVTLLMAYSSVPANWATPGMARVKEDFALTVAVDRFIEQYLDPKLRLRMWYAITPREPRPYRNISSTYLWGYILLNEAMPSLDSTQAASIVRDQQLVLLAADSNEVDAAQRALYKFGYVYVPRVQREFAAGESSFLVVIGEVFRGQL